MVEVGLRIENITNGPNAGMTGMIAHVWNRESGTPGRVISVAMGEDPRDYAVMLRIFADNLDATILEAEKW